jgi:hypothetical protein
MDCKVIFASYAEFILFPYLIWRGFLLSMLYKVGIEVF